MLFCADGCLSVFDFNAPSISFMPFDHHVATTMRVITYSIVHTQTGRKERKKKKEKSQVEPPSFKVFHKVWYPLPRPPVLGAWFDRVTVGVGPTASQVCINRFSSRQVHKQLGAQNPYSLELLIFSFVLPVSVLVTTCLDRPPFGSANDVHA